MKSITVNSKEFGINEECGVFGIISPEAHDIAHDIYYGLFALQHRGQESAGIAVSYEKRKTYYYKNMGLVNDVFSDDILTSFPESHVGVGHVRYSTSGSSNVVNSQPVVFYGRYGRMALAHNGNIINVLQLKSNMIKNGHIFQSSVDSEVIAALINNYSIKSIEDGLIKASKEAKGAFALVLFAEETLYAVRDANGLKPLIIGRRDDGSIVIASESCALDAVEAHIVRDVEPGEIVIINKKGEIKSIFFTEANKKSCIFEYVYFARSDSTIDNVSVYDARYECGRQLAKLFKIDADIVAGVPDSALVSAKGYSEVSGIPNVDALTKNRYIGRTFIQPVQSMRENSVRIKLSAFRSNIKGKRLILIDDSIVRGTTSKKIIQLLRQNGATEVHMLVCSPIVKHPCFFGVDMQTTKQLIGGQRTKEQICKEIGADSLNYLPLENMIAACKGKASEFCTGCFNAGYSIDVTECDKYSLE